MEEKRYSFSFMKEYQELYEITEIDLANIFHCGTKKVQKVLDGEILLKESLVEEILYEQGYNSYEKYKENIENKIKRKQEVLRLQKEKKNIQKLTHIKPPTKEEKIVKKSEVEKPNYISMFDLNKMSNKDILITVLLFGNVVNKNTSEIAHFLNIGEDYVLYVNKKTRSIIEKNKVKQKK